jgi:hypothetical protein
MKIGVLGGGGSFAQEFIPLFAAHPAVDEVVVADREADRRRAVSERSGIARTVGSLDELLDTDVDAVAIFTQRWLHAPQAIAALCAGAPGEDPARPRPGIDAAFSVGLSAVHDADRLPASYAGLPNGHYGSHQFLAVDFIEACTTGRRPSTTVWDAARYCAPGIVADASSRAGGTVMEVPSFPEPGRRASLDR